MSDFKEGDVVRLKSGSPAFTIAWINQDRASAGATWFNDQAQKVEIQEVKLSTLVKDEA